MIFDERLTELRKAKGLNQKECAISLGIDSSKYNKWENGKNNPDFETVCKLADYFCTTTDYLLGRIAAKNVENIAIIDELGLIDESIATIEKLRTFNPKLPTSPDDKRSLLNVFNDLLANNSFVTLLAVLKVLTDPNKIEWAATQWEGEKYANIFPVAAQVPENVLYERMMHEVLDIVLKQMKKDALILNNPLIPRKDLKKLNKNKGEKHKKRA